DENKPQEKRPRAVTVYSPEDEKKGEKIYLYTHLKQQPIWEKWCHMTQEERDDSLRFNENITFGQLGTFTHNMLAFGLNKKLCNDFLKKQAVIGNLDEEQYKLLSDHIEQMATE
ncbi:KIAA0513 isoform 6, partial [Pan troglodytes]